MFKKKIADMKREVKGYKSVEQLTKEAQIAKVELQSQKVETAKRREALKAQVQHDLRPFCVCISIGCGGWCTVWCIMHMCGLVLDAG